MRKKGKLPGAVISEEYTLEYGQATVGIHDDAITPGEKILVVDDLLATGSAQQCGIKLIERLGGEIIGCAFIVDLCPANWAGARSLRRWAWRSMPFVRSTGFRVPQRSHDDLTGGLAGAQQLQRRARLFQRRSMRGICGVMRPALNQSNKVSSDATNGRD